IPKDGPSAGITMATALISALTKRSAHRDVAMTGEITLRGRVLPIGGVKEKVLAAHRAGIKTFVLPKRNVKDLNDVPPEIMKELHFVAVEHMDDVIAVALYNTNHAKGDQDEIPVTMKKLHTRKVITPTAVTNRIRVHD
ncbi:MAG TPA: S16 family serine protease, partial [Ktedonobacteraceae bacterium]|nr:S16 family serine protease [Ktedonobacteraceae bacterium]